MPLTLKGLLDPEGPTLGLLLDESKLEQGTDDLVPFLTISSPTVDTSELTPDTEDAPPPPSWSQTCQPPA